MREGGIIHYEMSDTNKPTIEELLAHTAWVQGLSRRLVSDPSLADDLAQDTVVAALQNRGGPPRSIRAWLGKILLNMVREAHRREARRRQREAAAAGRDYVPSTFDVVDRASTHTSVAQAVLALKEPYRTVILMRFFDGLPPRKIASLLDAPVSTIETRLQRGLDRLRVELDHTHGGDRGRWQQALLVLAPPSGSLVTAVGGLLLAKKAIVLPAAAVLLSVSVVFVALEERDSGDEVPVVKVVADDGVEARRSDRPVETPRVDQETTESDPGGSIPLEPSGTTPPPQQQTESHGPPPAVVARSWRPRVDAAPSIPGMVLIPGGEATIGIDAVEIQGLGLDDKALVEEFVGSSPRHQEKLDAFYIDTTEVTNLQWGSFLDANGLEPNAKLVQSSWHGGRVPAGEESCPVVCVTFEEAREYARWAGRRLPTEEEWEYAACGADALRYPWGDEFRAGFVQSVEAGKVGGKPEGKSPFGVLDLAGNVSEWTSSPYVAYDRYEDIEVGTSFSKEGRSRVSASGSFAARKRVIRGGAWDCREHGLMSCLRQAVEPDTRLGTLGFRCARSVQPGRDAIEAAILDVGSHHFDGLELARESIVALEHLGSDGVANRCRGIAFAPVRKWPSLETVREDSMTRPFAIGILASTEDLLAPQVAAGPYVVAFQAGRSERKEDGSVSSKAGWVLEEWDLGLDHLLLLDRSGTAIAALAIAELLDTANHTEPRLTLQTFGDEDRYAFEFTVAMPDRKAASFSLPVVFEAGTFDDEGMAVEPVALGQETPADPEAKPKGRDAAVPGRPVERPQDVSTVSPPSFGDYAPSGEPVLRAKDLEKLRRCVTTYLRSRRDDDLKGTAKSYEELEKSLASVAKASRLETLLASPCDLRAIFSAPLEPEKRLQQGSFYEKSFELSLYGGKESYPYLLWLPRSYSHTREAVPLVLALHPQLSTVYDIKRWARESFPTELTQDVAVLVPLNPDHESEWTSLEGRMLSFFCLADFALRYHLDRSRVFLHGEGMEGEVVREYADRYPGMFSGIILKGAPPRGGAAGFLNEEESTLCLEVLDPAEAGETYRDFCLNTKKHFAPLRVKFTTESEESVNAFWLHLIKLDASSGNPVTIEGWIDQASNEVHVETTPGVRGFRIYLNDDLVDMDRPIRVLHSLREDDRMGRTWKVLFEGTKSRSLEKALTIWFDNLSGNYGEVYTNFIEIELP
ncbi:MAG: sigma-70 family RNA polymerase sigma factor [Planctomycetota bacterium]